jgi:predicted NBD/HSP70 family sugar kinase
MISLMAVFEPEVVIIGGELAGAGRYLLEGIHAAMEEIDPWVYYSDVLITLVRHKNDAGVIGAAALAEYYIDGDEE